MEDSTSDDEDHFLDASDGFPFSDYFSDTIGDSVSQSQSSSSFSASSPESKLIEFNPKSRRDTPSSAPVRRRRSFGNHQRSRRDTSPRDLTFGCSIDDEISRMNETTTDAERGFVSDTKRMISGDFGDHGREGGNSAFDAAEQSSGRPVERVGEEIGEDSTVTNAARDDRIMGEEVSTSVREFDGDQSSFLVVLAGLVIKAIGYQFSLLISFITFPLWVAYRLYLFLVNPFQAVRRGRGYLIGMPMRICNAALEIVTPYLSKWFEENKSLVQLVLRCGWGLFWSAYVCVVLVGLLVSGFVVGGLMMRPVLEEPFRLKQALNFDYTQSSPVAFVPIMGCPAMACVNCVVKAVGGNVGAMRVIHPNHKLQATIEMSLPESDYNRNLGMFQVRMEFLGTNGKALASSSHSCMLQFRSDPIRMLLMFFKVIPLVAGYVSESQTLKLTFNGFTEDVVPTACLKITIEQRAEFGTGGAGIPQVYDAFLLVQSELPFLKRILWQWRRSIHVWLSMMVFTVELLFALVCCRPLVIPRVRPQGAAAAAPAAAGYGRPPRLP
ncbi:hypothetical protein Dimus_033088 [Dionaea muscipula]